LYAQHQRWILPGGMGMRGGFASDRFATQVAAELWRPPRNSGTTALASGGEIMNAYNNPRNRVFRRWSLSVACVSILITAAFGQSSESTATRRVNLQEAVEMALKHNHVVRISTLKVEENEHAKEVARSAYLPVLSNDSTFVHLTDTQFIEIPVGGFGAVGNTPIPSHSLIINQGEQTFETSGTGLVQPITQLFKIKAGNDAARAELEASRGRARSVQNEVALKVRQIYYKILVVESQHRAIEAKIRASEDLNRERIQQVK